MWQALLGLGLEFAGGRMAANEQKRADKRNMWMWQQEMKQAQHQFDQQMDQSVRRRVEDAVRAGVHPLFALGASVGASPTVSSGGAPYSSGNTGMSSALQNMGRMIANVNTAQAKRDEAEAAYLDSQRALNEQRLNSEGRDAFGTGKTRALPDNTIDRGDYLEYKPEVPAQSKPGLRAGPIPERLQLTTRDGRKIEVLNPDAGLDEIGQAEYVRQKGVMWTADRIEDIMGFLKSRGGTSDKEIAAMERRLDALRKDRQTGGKKAKEAAKLWDEASRKVRSFFNWRSK